MIGVSAYENMNAARLVGATLAEHLVAPDEELHSIGETLRMPKVDGRLSTIPAARERRRVDLVWLSHRQTCSL
jgi:hypothetical protein